jgi:hypothetical protein
MQNQKANNSLLKRTCQEYFQQSFKEDCYEMQILNWFKDNFVSDEDMMNYYEISTFLINKIETADNKDLIYSYIYNAFISVSITAIEEGNYDLAYHHLKTNLLNYLNEEKEVSLGERVTSIVKLKLTK